MLTDQYPVMPAISAAEGEASCTTTDASAQFQLAASRKRQADIKEAHLKFEADHAIKLAKLDAKQKVCWVCLLLDE